MYDNYPEFRLVLSFSFLSILFYMFPRNHNNMNLVKNGKDNDGGNNNMNDTNNNNQKIH